MLTLYLIYNLEPKARVEIVNKIQHCHEYCKLLMIQYSSFSVASFWSWIKNSQRVAEAKNARKIISRTCYTAINFSRNNVAQKVAQKILPCNITFKRQCTASKMIPTARMIPKSPQKWSLEIWESENFGLRNWRGVPQNWINLSCQTMISLSTKQKQNSDFKFILFIHSFFLPFLILSFLILIYGCCMTLTPMSFTRRISTQFQLKLLSWIK